MRVSAILLFCLAGIIDAGEPPWPKDLPFPKGMVKYTRAAKTQSIGITQGVDGIRRHHVDQIARTRLDEVWNVPGGLEGVKGWHSDLYKFIPEYHWQWIGDAQVKNSLGYFQLNRGHRREYRDGTFFCDVLSKDGQVFEVRYRERVNGRWDNTVAYRNAAARPVGYARLSITKCAECHDQAGTGNYGVGLVPGGDWVISDPIGPLEAASSSWPVARGE